MIISVSQLSKEELQHLEDTHGDKEELQQGDNSENADEADVKIESEEVIVKEGNCDNDSGLGTAGNVDSRKVTNTVESSKGSSAEPASQTPKTDQRRGGNPSMHRYTSLSDVLNDGSPVAQKLFSSTGSREGTDMVEKARKLLVRTGKVILFLCAFTLEGQKSRCIVDKLHGFCLFVLSQQFFSYVGWVFLG